MFDPETTIWSLVTLAVVVTIVGSALVYFGHKSMLPKKVEPEEETVAITVGMTRKTRNAMEQLRVLSEKTDIGKIFTAAAEHYAQLLTARAREATIIIRES